MAEAYSAAVYSLARKHSWILLACPNNPCGYAHAKRVAVLPVLKRRQSGWKYHLEEARYGLRLAKVARRFRADVMISTTGIHPLVRLAMCTAGIPIVLSIHNTFWTRATSPPSGLRAFLSRIACRMSRQVRQAVCVSDEIKHQAIWMGLLQPNAVRVFVPQYSIDSLPWQEPIVRHDPAIVLFAGRIESSKGIDDILAASHLLEARHPGRFVWHIAGDGSYLASARQRCQQLGLDHAVRFLGHLDRTALSAEISVCWVTITPTRTDFPEGLAKLPIEGAACGKPAIVSTAVPAIDLLSEAAEPVEPSSPASIADAVERLYTDQSLYLRRHQACHSIRTKISDPNLGYGSMLEAAVSDALAIKRG